MVFLWFSYGFSSILYVQRVKFTRKPTKIHRPTGRIVEATVAPAVPGPRMLVQHHVGHRHPLQPCSQGQAALATANDDHLGMAGWRWKSRKTLGKPLETKPMTYESMRTLAPPKKLWHLRKSYGKLMTSCNVDGKMAGKLSTLFNFSCFLELDGCPSFSHWTWTYMGSCAIWCIM